MIEDYDSRNSNSTAQLSTFSKLEERRLRDLEQAFMEAADIIITDPLMDVFKQKEETQQFMFERIQEIINEGIREANDKYVKEVLIKMEEMNKCNEKLKKENKKITKSNIEFQTKIHDFENNINISVEEKVKALTEDIECYKATINVVQSENMKLEEINKQVNKEVENLKNELSERDKFESITKVTIDQLRSEIKNLKKMGNKRDEELKEAMKEDEEKNKLEKMNEDLVRKIREMEEESEKTEAMNVELVRGLEKELNNHKENYECLSREYEQLEQLINDNTKIGKMREEIKLLNDTMLRASKELDGMIQIKEDLEFEKKQLEQTIEELRAEIKEVTQKLSMERKIKQGVESKMIELKDQNSELNMINSDLKDELTTTTQEVRIFILFIFLA